MLFLLMYTYKTTLKFYFVHYVKVPCLIIFPGNSWSESLKFVPLTIVNVHTNTHAGFAKMHSCLLKTHDSSTCRSLIFWPIAIVKKKLQKWTLPKSEFREKWLKGIFLLTFSFQITERITVCVFVTVMLS